MTAAARRPSSVCVGGMRMSVTTTSGRCSRTWSRSSSRVACLADHDEAGVLEHAHDARPQQERVLGHDDAERQRSRAGQLRSQPRALARRARDLERSAERRDAVGQAAKPGAVAGAGAAHAVVAHLHEQRVRRRARPAPSRARRARTWTRSSAPRRPRSTPPSRRPRAGDRRRGRRCRPGRARARRVPAPPARARVRRARRDGCRAPGRAARRGSARARRSSRRAAPRCRCRRTRSCGRGAG